MRNPGLLNFHDDKYQKNTYYLSYDFFRVACLGNDRLMSVDMRFCIIYFSSSFYMYSFSVIEETVETTYCFLMCCCIY